VVHVAQGSRPRQQHAEQALALEDGQRPEVEVLEGHQVEKVEGRGQLDGGPLDVGGPLQEGSALEPLEARAGLLVQADHLAVHDQVREGQGGHGPCHLGEDAGCIVAPAIEKAGLFALGGRHHPEAVVLQLEDPAGVGEGLVAGLRQHELHGVGGDPQAGGAQALEVGPDLRGPRGTFDQLFDGRRFSPEGLWRAVGRALGPVGSQAFAGAGLLGGHRSGDRLAHRDRRVIRSFNRARTPP
jgi:hypothetical protein